MIHRVVIILALSVSMCTAAPAITQAQDLASAAFEGNGSITPEQISFSIRLLVLATGMLGLVFGVLLCTDDYAAPQPSPTPKPRAQADPPRERRRSSSSGSSSTSDGTGAKDPPSSGGISAEAREIISNYMLNLTKNMVAKMLEGDCDKLTGLAKKIPPQVYIPMKEKILDSDSMPELAAVVVLGGVLYGSYSWKPSVLVTIHEAAKEVLGGEGINDELGKAFLIAAVIEDKERSNSHEPELSFNLLQAWLAFKLKKPSTGTLPMYTTCVLLNKVLGAPDLEDNIQNKPDMLLSAFLDRVLIAILSGSTPAAALMGLSLEALQKTLESQGGSGGNDAETGELAQSLSNITDD